MLTRAQILRLSALGAQEQAWAAFHAGGWEARSDAEATLLKARLLKDRAVRAGGEERRNLFLQSAAAYAAAAEGRSAYALINAASLALLGGDLELARNRAGGVLNLLASGDHDPDTDYWLGATRAEALLLLGDVPSARIALKEAIATTPRAWEEHAITLRQFALLLDLLGEDSAWLDGCRPQPVLHFAGIMTADPRDADAASTVKSAVEAIAPSAAYGALAAGADILVAEALLALGAELNVVLPADPDAFCAESVRAIDEAWVPRFEKLLASASSIEVAGSGVPLSEVAIDLADEVAMGMAIARAEALATRPRALRITAGGAPDRSLPHQLWRGAGLGLDEVPISRSPVIPRPGLASSDAAAAILVVRGTAADRIETGERVVVHAAEGDEVQLLFENLSAALDAASALPTDGVSAGLDLRIAMPPLADRDFAGALVAADAASPGGLVATRHAAAAVRLHRPSARSDLLGEVRTAFGTEELWRVRPAPA